MSRFEKGSKKVKSLFKRAEELRTIFQWNQDIPNMPLYQEKFEDKNSFLIRKIPDELKILEQQLSSDRDPKLNPLPWNFSSEDEKTQGVLDLIQAPLLDKDSHKLQGVSQSITSQISAQDRNRDFQARIAAQVNLSSLLNNEAVLGLLQKISEDENLSSSAKESLSCAKTLLQITNQVNSHGAKLNLSAVQKIRQELRAKSTNQIKDVDIKDNLRNDSMSGTKLFLIKQRKMSKRLSKIQLLDRYLCTAETNNILISLTKRNQEASWDASLSYSYQKRNGPFTNKAGYTVTQTPKGRSFRSREESFG